MFNCNHHCYLFIQRFDFHIKQMSFGNVNYFCLIFPKSTFKPTKKRLPGEMKS